MDKFTQYTPLIQEFIARKQQVLNLEIRLFILVIVIEVLFIVLYSLYREKINQKGISVMLSATAYFVFFFELIAIYGKMGLVSMYLRQLENYLMQLGFSGAVWESRALDAIIFVPGNAFTLPAALSVLLIVFQTIFVFYFTMAYFFQSRKKKLIFTVLISGFIIYLIIKALTVDFFRELPNIFS